eukprot:5174992-Prymnesium_polylepis.1
MVVQTRRNSTSPARSLQHAYADPPVSTLGLDELQVSYPLMQQERDRLLKELGKAECNLAIARDAARRLIDEKEALVTERDRLATRCDAHASAERKEDRLHAALKNTLGLVHQVLTFDWSICKKILKELPAA